MTDARTFLYRLGGALDIAADDLAECRAEIDRARELVESSSPAGARLWSALGRSSHRLDVHIKSFRSLAERSRRKSEEPDRPGRGDAP